LGGPHAALVRNSLHESPPLLLLLAVLFHLELQSFDEGLRLLLLK
jgi:hypothetical protein